MAKKSERGNVIELVIIGVLVLSVIGLVAWRFIDANKKVTDTSTQSASTSTESQNETDKTVLGYEGVRTTSKNGAFSMVVPNGWKMMNFQNDNNISSGPTFANIQYDAAKSPQITDAEAGGWDGYTQHFYVLVPYSPYTPSGAATELMLNNGLKAQKYVTVIAEGTTSEAYGTIEDTYRNYAYVITKGDVTVEAHFAIFDKTQYDRGLIDNVVKSIEIR